MKTRLLLLLVVICMLPTETNSALAQVIAADHIAKFGYVSFVKDIIVTKSTRCYDSSLSSVSNPLVLSCVNDALGFNMEINNAISTDGHLIPCGGKFRAVFGNGYIDRIWPFISLTFHNRQPFGRCFPVILESNGSGKGFIGGKTLDGEAGRKKIGPERPPFLISLIVEDNSGDTRINTNGYQCEQRYPIFWLVEIATLFCVAAFGFYWGLPRHDLFGFLAILGACVGIAAGTSVSFAHILGFSDSKNASASFGSVCASATIYRRAGDAEVLPIDIPKLEFRNLQGQTFSAHLKISPDDALVV
jgi:hypothetical protein